MTDLAQIPNSIETLKIDGYLMTELLAYSEELLTCRDLASESHRCSATDYRDQSVMHPVYLCNRLHLYRVIGPYRCSIPAIIHRNAHSHYFRPLISMLHSLLSRCAELCMYIELENLYNNEPVFSPKRYILYSDLSNLDGIKFIGPLRTGIWNPNNVF